MKSFFLITPGVLILLLVGSAAGQKLSVTERTANLLSSPSLTGSTIVLQVPRNYPLDVLEEQDDFLQVRDFLGRASWIEKTQVGPGTGVIVQATMANLRSGPGVNHPVVFKARRGVTFRVLDDQSQWLHVEHESGQQGWIASQLVWGWEPGELIGRIQ